MERRLAAIFALDMVGYSRLMESDEADTLARQESLRADLIDPTISGHHGRVVKGTGDGLLAEFASAVDAVECAAEIQRGMVEREADVPRERRIEFRIGINVGDIVARDGDIFGDGVNVAARIESLADPSGILVSGTAYNQVLNKVKVGFEDLGSQMVKNLERPVQVYRVLLDSAAADAPSGGSSRRPTMRQLLRRRVPQFVGLYLLSGWAVLEFVDWAVRQYSLSPTISSFVVALLLLLLPSVAWLAWRHGTPGPDGWSRADFTVTLANLVVAALILGSTFGGEELGAATTTKMLENEEGEQVERAVPKQSLVRKVQIVGFDNESGDPELDWLSFGIPIAINLDLGQDAFVRVTGPAAESESVVWGLDVEGYSPPFADVPLSLLRDLAERSGVARFLAGELRVEGDTVLLMTRLHDSGNARLVAEHSYRSVDPLEIVDQLSVDLRRDLGVPEWQIDKAVDLPVSELFTSSPEAFRLYASAQINMTSFIARYDAGLEDLERALEYDSASAELLAESAGMQWYFGDRDVAVDRLAEAMRRSYRLSERSRLELRAFQQEVAEEDLEGAMRTLLFWAELYPEDPDPWKWLSLLRRDLGDADGEIDALRTAIAIDPSDPAALRRIARTLRGTGASDSALAYFRLVQDRWPSDAEAYTGAAKLLADLGRHEDAREVLSRALLVAAEDGAAERMMLRLDIRNGRFDKAAGDLRRISGETQAGTYVFWNVLSQQTLAYETGRFALVEESFGSFIQSGAEWEPLQLVFSAPVSEFLQFAVEGGRGDVALRQLDSLRSMLAPPLSHSVDVATARIHVDRGAFEDARASLARLEEMVAALDESWLPHFWVDWHRARVLQLEDGNCQRAIGEFDRALEAAGRWSFAQVMYDPLNARLPTERAACLRSLGRLGEAREAIDAIVDRFPGSAMVRLEAARVYEAQGRTAEAIVELETALEAWAGADPEYVPAREAREFLQELLAGEPQ